MASMLLVSFFSVCCATIFVGYSWPAVLRVGYGGRYYAMVVARVDVSTNCKGPAPGFIQLTRVSGVKNRKQDETQTKYE